MMYNIQQEYGEIEGHSILGVGFLDKAYILQLFGLDMGIGCGILTIASIMMGSRWTYY